MSSVFTQHQIPQARPLPMVKERPRVVRRMEPRIEPRTEATRKTYRGYLEPSILYHLRVVESASVYRLEALIGAHRSGILVRLKTMIDAGLLVSSTPVAAVVYSLTKAGRAEAALVRREEVEFA